MKGTDENDQSIVVTPVNFTVSPRKALSGTIIVPMLFFLTIIIVFGLANAHAATRNLYYLIIAISVPYMFVWCFLRRIPTRIEIDPTSTTLIVDYLNGFGTSKRSKIRLTGAMVRYVLHNFRNLSSGYEVRITQNIINGWIYVDKSHGFSQDQIKFIYDSVKPLTG